MIPACPSFIAIVHNGKTGSTIFRFKKMLFMFVFVYILYVIENVFYVTCNIWICEKPRGDPVWLTGLQVQAFSK